jgi:hypothetical protein
MEKKIKIKQSVQVLNDAPYSEILETVNNLKSKIQTELKESGLEDKFEIEIEVTNINNSIVIKTDKNEDYMIPVR